MPQHKKSEQYAYILWKACEISVYEWFFLPGTETKKHFETKKSSSQGFMRNMWRFWSTKFNKITNSSERDTHIT